MGWGQKKFIKIYYYDFEFPVRKNLFLMDCA